MTGSRLALVADDPRMGGSIQAHLAKACGQEVILWTPGTARTHIVRDEEGLLVLAAGTSTEAEQVLRLVQEICLQKLPLLLLLVETGEVARERSLARLDPQLIA